jgi:hypothetical protein
MPLDPIAASGCAEIGLLLTALPAYLLNSYEQVKITLAAASLE